MLVFSLLKNICYFRLFHRVFLKKGWYVMTGAHTMIGQGDSLPVFPGLNLLHSQIQDRASKILGSEPILITGAQGTGKTHLAFDLHHRVNPEGQFITVNFHSSERGAEGSICSHLDEALKSIGDSPPPTILIEDVGYLTDCEQMKLLSILNHQSFTERDSTQSKAFPCFIFASRMTTSTLRSLLREDFFLKIGLCPLQLMDLRTRPQDLELFINHFMQEAQESMELDRVFLPIGCLELLRHYAFPGNIAELRSIIFRVISAFPVDAPLSIFEDLLKEASKRVEKPVLAHTGGGLVSFSESALPTIKHSTRALIQEALQRTKGNQTRAARLLGITQQALSERIRRARKMQEPLITS
jgi:DNA-binding NtrC family response regulator